MVEFFKKIDKNTHSDVFDSSVSSHFSDLSEKGTVLKVRSGMFQDLALFDFPVPHTPSFGDGKLVGLDFRFTMSDTDVTNKVNYQGEHNIFLFKENKNMGDEEGTAKRIVDSTNQVFAPAMTIFSYVDDFGDDPFSVYVEDFSDTDEDVIAEEIAGNIVHREFHYLTLDDAHDSYGNVPTGQTSGWSPSKDSLESDYGSTHPLTGEIIIEVKAKDDGWESVKSVPYIGKLFWYNNASMWNLRMKEKGVKDKVKSLSKTVAETTLDEQNSFKEITSDSTFFDNVQVPPNVLKPAAAVASEDSTTEFKMTDTVFHAYAGANFSTEKNRTAGSALNLRAHIDYDGKVQNAATPENQKKFDFGTGYNRQSICVMKQNIPAPTRFFDDTVTPKSYGYNNATPSMLKEIDIDIYFDELACAYVIDASSNATIHNQNNATTFTHLRSLAILFGHNDVDDNQDFADYIDSHLSSDAEIDLDNTTDVTNNLMGVMFYRVPNATEGTGSGVIEIKTLRGDSNTKVGTDDEVTFDRATSGATHFNNPKVLGWTTHSTPAGYQLTTGKWYRLKFVYDIQGGDGIQDNNDASGDAASNMQLWIFDGDTNELATANLGGDSTGNAYLNPINVTNCNVDPADLTNETNRWPQNMSIWLNNIANQHDSDAAGKEDMLNTEANNNPLYTRSSVFIDKISFRNQNLRHANASGENNPHFSSTKGIISSGNKTLRFPANFGGSSSPFDIPSTGLALGFNDRTQLNGVTGYLLFNGFSSSGNKKPTAIADASLNAGASTNALPVKMGDVADVMGGGSDLLDSLTIGASGTNILTGDGVNGSVLQDVDGFSQKGVVSVSNITWDNDNDKRECAWASAKIIKSKGVAGTVAELVVDDPVILSAPRGTQFIIYKMNHSLVDYDAGNASTTSNYSIVELTKLDGNVATFAYVSNTPLNLLIQDGSGFASSSYSTSIQHLWVSPYLFWLFIQTTDNGATGVTRTYQSVCSIDDDLAATNGGKGLGVTFNEESFSTNSGNTEYFLRRSLSTTTEDTIFDTQDFGFGDAKDGEAGYVARFVPKLGVNDINLDNVLGKRKFIAGDRFSFAITPHSASTDTTIAICSGSHGTAANRPKLFARFEDELPTVEDFTVTPNKDNPQFLDFNWKTDAKDLWYGLLHIDNKQINSQYENAIAHMPLDEDSVAASTVFLYYPNQGDRYTDRSSAGSRVAATVTDTDGTASTVTAERDGLAGFCKQFDAVDSELDFGTGSGLTDPGNEMTLVAHCIPNVVTSTATRNLFFRDSFLTVTLQSASAGTFVQAVIQNSNDDTYTLKSPYIYTDGETPLSVIVTFDKDITANNAKLFVNGALSDSLDVDLDYGLKVNNSDIIIGNDDNNDNDGFNGKIEEVVLYNKCLEVINPQSQKFTYTKPLKNGETNKATSAGSGSPETYYARLFLKDYHNIRGYTSDEVASSSQLTVRKTSFRLADT